MIAIDLTDPGSFPPPLIEVLESARGLFFDYYKFENETFEIRKQDDLEYLSRRNPHYGWFNQFQEITLSNHLKQYSIYGWHYTRLLNYEIKEIMRSGLHPSTFKSFEKRIDNAVKRGYLCLEDAQTILNNTPLNDKEQRQCRENKLFFVSKRQPLDDTGIKPFLSRWGGEVVFFWGQKPALNKKLQSLGSPIILEVRIPITMLRKHISSISTAVIGNFFDPGNKFDIVRELDIYIEEPLPFDFIDIQTVMEPAS